MSDIHARRRQRVLERLGGGVLVLPATAEAHRSGDTEHRYRPSSDLLYLTGFRESGSVLVLSAVHEKSYTLFVRPKDKEAETWTGRRAGVEGAVSTFGASQAFTIDSLDKELPKLLTGAQTLWTTLGVDPAWDARIIHLVSEVRTRTRTGALVPLRIADPGPLLHELRLIKEAEEIEALREAARLTDEGFRAAMRATRVGAREYELEAEMLYAFRHGGGEGPGYECIVAGGVNATILHYRTGRDALKAGELVLADCGCEVESGHTADVTRTWPVDGTFTAAQKALYEIVLESNVAGCEAVRPGATKDEVHEVSTRVIIRGLLRLGLLSGDEDALFADKSNKSYRRFYMHSTSHWLGIDVHDVGPYHQAATPRPLAPGMVLTIEPGLYISEDDTTVPAEYRGIGIRIEDDVLVTAEGHEVLTASIPKTIEAMEAARR